MLAKKVLVHGDFGNDNFFIQDGVIDWEKSFVGNHFVDVGRIVLYCPHRMKSSLVALDFYKYDGNFKDKILFGVYYTMCTNYGAAVGAKWRNHARVLAEGLRK